MENLFTKEELTEIENDALSNFDYYLGTVVFNGNCNERTIITISAVNHLIFVEGNDHTGFAHLRDRHGFFSNNNYWKTDGVVTPKLDNQSRFHPKMMPIVDYVKIADSIFVESNKNVSKNKNPDIFDVYTGCYSYEEEKESPYLLIVYKNTSIVHTLYPQKKTNNVKRKFKYPKGIVSSSLKVKFPSGGYNDLVIPYVNEQGTTVYSIFITKDYAKQKEQIFIRKHDITGMPVDFYLLGTRTFSTFETFGMEEISQYQLGDLSDFEEILKEIDEKTDE